MNEITKTVFFLMMVICVVATIIEGLKKLLSAKQEEGGKTRLKTQLHKSAIIALALDLSVIGVMIAYMGGGLFGELPMIVLYIAIVFTGQWIVDMAVVKKIAEKIIEKVLNKI